MHSDFMHQGPEFLVCSSGSKWQRPGAEFGGTEFIFSQTKISEWRFFEKNLHFHGQVFRIFPFFSQIFRFFTMLNVVYDPFLIRKTPFFTLFILSRASDNTTAQNIGGTDEWAVPHLKF